MMTTTTAARIEKKTVSADVEKTGKLKFHSFVWIFTISSVIGVVVETVFCLIFKGYLESRQGVIYGPFNQIYGFGAILLAFILLHVRKKGIVAVFGVSALIGGAFETVCSLVQEYIFDTVSWDYSWMPSPISLCGGRTNLLYMLFFGVLGVVYLYLLFPPLTKLSDRIYKGRGVAVTWLVAIFMSVNLLLSATVVARWSQRVEGVPPATVVDEMVDRYYPDNVLQVIYPSMIFSKAA